MTTLTRSTLSTKLRASIYAVAICDALGAPAEFQRRDTFPHITTMQPNPTFGLPAGCWTDDTSLMLCLAFSLFHVQGFSAQHQAATYARWMNKGFLSVTGECFDVGNATREALSIWVKDPREEEGLRTVLEVLSGGNRCGNGSLMRVLPVALMYYRQSDEVVARKARESGVVTHPNPICGDACAIYSILAATILRQTSTQIPLTKSDLITLIDTFAYTTPTMRYALAEKPWASIQRSDIKSSGYVVHTLQAALWAFLGTDTFEDGAVRVVNLGDDADTVAAVYGGIAGMWYARDCNDEGDGGGWWGERGHARGWWRDLKGKEMVNEAVEMVLKVDTEGGFK